MEPWNVSNKVVKKVHGARGEVQSASLGHRKCSDRSQVPERTTSKESMVCNTKTKGCNCIEIETIHQAKSGCLRLFQFLFLFSFADSYPQTDRRSRRQKGMQRVCIDDWNVGMQCWQSLHYAWGWTTNYRLQWRRAHNLARSSTPTLTIKLIQNWEGRYSIIDLNRKKGMCVFARA